MSETTATGREELNARLRRTSIRGNAYIDVAQRIDGFWQLYPNGSIETVLLEDTGQRCTVKAIARDGERVLATGHAFEDRKGSVNQTSYIENCETSAVGRALGILGIGSTDFVASAEEVRWAVEQQQAAPQGPQQEPQPRQDRRARMIAKAAELRAECERRGVRPEGIDAYMEASLGTTRADELDEPGLTRYGQYLRDLLASADELGRGDDWNRV